MKTVQESLQRFSRAVIVPVKFMAVMGLVLALGIILQLDFMPEIIQTFGSLFSTMMNTMLNNLSLIFAVGIAASLADRKKVEAGLLALISFLIFLAANNAWLDITGQLAEPGVQGLFGTGQAIVLGIQVVDMNVFLGMIIGALVGYVHNKYSDVQFHDFFSMYGETRFTFIILIPLILIVAIALSYIWPVINSLIALLSGFIYGAGLLGLFVYAFLNRFLVPTGLHHLMWMPFSYTALGGTAEIAGEVYHGAVNILFAQMANIDSVTSLHESLRFVQFGFVKVVGSIAIVAAFIYTADKNKKEETKGQLYPSMFVAVLAGITEPLDFTFLFVSPLLWFVHSLLTAISETLLWALGSRTYMLYGLIDTVVVNSVIPPSITRFWIPILVGIIMMGIWFVVFVYLIKKFDLKTPGRDPKLAGITDIPDSDVNNTDIVVNSDTELDYIVAGLGGKDNIDTLTNCYSRLRVRVLDESKVDVDEIQKAKSQKGIFTDDKNVQIVIGMGVQEYRERLSDKIGYSDE